MLGNLSKNFNYSISGQRINAHAETIVPPTILKSYLLLSEADHRTVTTFMVPPFLTTLTVTVAGVSVSGSSTLIPLTSNSENIPNNIDTCSLFKF